MPEPWCSATWPEHAQGTAFSPSATPVGRTASAILLTRMPEANPFQDPLRFERRVPPCAIVIFGANGDLTKRKLIPALYRLAYERRLPPGFAIIGNSRTGMTDDAFREKMKEGSPRVP